VDQFAILWYLAVVITRINEINAAMKALNENVESLNISLIFDICKIQNTEDTEICKQYVLTCEYWKIA